MGKRKGKGPSRKGLTQRRGDGGTKRRDEGQVRADMEEMRVHGGEEERRKVKATGMGAGSREERRGGWGRGEPLTC